MSEQPPEIPGESGRQPQSLPGSNTPGLRQPDWLRFAIGFLGWYLINGAIWFLYPVREGGNIYNGVLTLFGNIVVLLALGSFRSTRWVAFGALIALVLNMLISLVMGLFAESICMVPFFAPR